VLNKAVEID